MGASESMDIFLVYICCYFLSINITLPLFYSPQGIRSRLRPYGNALTEIEMNITEKTKVLKPGEESNQKLRDPLKESVMPLDPFIYNEVEFTNLSNDNKILCLRE